MPPGNTGNWDSKSSNVPSAEKKLWMITLSAQPVAGNMTAPQMRMNILPAIKLPLQNIAKSIYNEHPPWCIETPGRVNNLLIYSSALTHSVSFRLGISPGPHPYVVVTGQMPHGQQQIVSVEQ